MEPQWLGHRQVHLNTTIALSRTAKRGYEALLDRYRKVAPSTNRCIRGPYVRGVRRAPVAILRRGRLLVWAGVLFSVCIFVSEYSYFIYCQRCFVGELLNDSLGKQVVNPLLGQFHKSVQQL